MTSSNECNHLKNLSHWNINEKPRIVYSQGLCLVVLFNDNTFDEFIDINKTQFTLDGEGFGIE